MVVEARGLLGEMQYGFRRGRSPRRGGGYYPHLMVGGIRPEQKYRGVRELLFIPKKGGVKKLE